MMQCCAGICGGSKPKPAAAEAHKAAAEPKKPEVFRPIVPIGEPDAPPVASLEALVEEREELILAPPGAEWPLAVCTKDFPRNCLRLLVVVPSPDAPAGSWGVGEQGSPVPLFRWGEANGYAVCLFRAEALATNTAEVFDRVLRGSPASTVSIVAGAGATPLVGTALSPLHPLLFNRFRTFCAPYEVEASPAYPADLPKELLEHLAGVRVRAPPAWGQAPVVKVTQELFELLALREERFQRGEGRKYAGFQTLKENDMPGLRRMPVEQRIQRLDRDRGDDELARLLKKNENAEEDEEEPGVD